MLEGPSAIPYPFSVKILVALSGGIDSSTVAHMLKEQGHELVGVRFTLWSDPLAPAIDQILPSKCCNPQTAYRAKKTAEDLGIPYHIVDLEEDFKREVIDPFLDGHKNGITLNPCIRCNRTIKFGKLLDLMKQYGCEKIATGHYARVASERAPDGNDHFVLLEAVDAKKDQSYYLYGLSQEQLQHVIFPLGGMQKRDVFTLATHYNVPLPDEYQESQDLCFFPEKSPQEFLKRYLHEMMVPGNIVRRDGKIIGSHQGLPLYTVGQRHGLKIGGLKVPLEVVSKNSVSNELIVSDKDSEKVAEIQINELRWISWKPPENQEVQFQCRTRSLSEKNTGTLAYQGQLGTFRLNNAMGPQAPGQSLVFYRGEEVVGGGVML